jgi:hypothetical protein
MRKPRTRRAHAGLPDRNRRVAKLSFSRILWRSISWQFRQEPIQPELVALAAEVAAAASSARAVLANVPQGPERGRLLVECEFFAEAAGEVLDPRSQLQDLAESQLGEMIEIFMQYQEQTVLLRSAVYRLAEACEAARSVIRIRR